MEPGFRKHGLGEGFAHAGHVRWPSPAMARACGVAAAVSSSVRSAQKRSSAPICLRTRRKRRSSASVSLASAADGHSEGQWTPKRLIGEHPNNPPSTTRARASWGWFWGWVPSCGWCSEAPWRAKSGGRRSDLRNLEVDRLRGSAARGGGSWPSQTVHKDLFQD